jgi:hypothetical protein
MSLEIYYFSKYRICGATIHKTYFFFHWIDLKDLYGIINFYSVHINIHIFIDNIKVLIYYYNTYHNINVTNIHYIDNRLNKIYEEKMESSLGLQTRRSGSIR